MRKEFATKIDLHSVSQQFILTDEELKKLNQLSDLGDKKLRDLQEKGMGNSNMISAHSELIEEL